MKNKIILMILLLTLVTVITLQINAQTTLNYDVYFSKENNGIVKIMLDAKEPVKAKLIIQKGDIKYTYNLSSRSEYESFPLQLGDGKYTITILKNIYGTSYKKIYSKTFEIDIEDENAVFLASNQQIKWEKSDLSIKLAQQLIASALYDKYSKLINKSGELTDIEIIEIIYNYVVQNIDYDYNKIKTLNYDYIPVIDEILNTGSGICYDYAVLFAAMLRSQNIPTKLIKGYSTATDVYHAWNEVYIKNEDRWIIIDTTYDANRYKHNRSYSMEKSKEDYIKEYEY